MNFSHAILFGLVQGLTEFLPISSSAHLVLLPWFTGWPDPGLAYDVALHWGTLMGVLIYFGRDLAQLGKSFLGWLGGQKKPGDDIPIKILVATFPGALLGFVFEGPAETLFRSPLVIVGTLVVMGIFLYLADRYGPRKIGLFEISWNQAILIGISQGLAIVPGVSRSGITITTALFMGLERTAAVRFSFYLSIPIIAGAGLLKAHAILSDLSNFPLLVGMVSSALSGILAIHFLMTYVRTKTFTPFVIYRFLLAGVVLVFLRFRP